MIEVTQADRDAAKRFFGDAENHPVVVKSLAILIATHRQQAVDEATRPLVEALERVTEHLAVWAGDYPEDRTSETEAAIYCARRALAQHTGAQ